MSGNCGGGKAPEVHGVDVDAQTRCAHYHKSIDIIAIKMKCCGEYYACKNCHDELAGHGIVVWPEAEREQRAVLCGGCLKELSISQYLKSNSICPACGSGFNPLCSNHYHDYFAGDFGRA